MMKVLIFLVMLIAIVTLWRDNKSKATQLDNLRTQLDAANQQVIEAKQSAQQLSTQLTQLQSRFTTPGAPGAQAYAPVSAPPASQPPSWFQNQRSGAQPSILDPHGPPP